MPTVSTINAHLAYRTNYGQDKDVRYLHNIDAELTMMDRQRMQNFGIYRL